MGSDLVFLFHPGNLVNSIVIRKKGKKERKRLDVLFFLFEFKKKKNN